GVQAHSYVQATPRNMPVDFIPNLRLQHLHLARECDENLALFPIHGTELDGDLEAVLGAFAAPVSRHRFHPQKDRLSHPTMSNAELDGHLKTVLRCDLRNIFITAAA